MTLASTHDRKDKEKFLIKSYYLLIILPLGAVDLDEDVGVPSDVGALDVAGRRHAIVVAVTALNGEKK